MISTTERAAVALFVSNLQPSQAPSADAVEAAVTEMLERFGTDGCAAYVAAEFGDHPDTAPRRMAWVREILRIVVPAVHPAAVLT
jgi:hypothetical protein